MNLNSTLVYGLSNEEELATIQSEYVLHFSEKEYIFLSDEQEALSVLNELTISLSINSHREILIAKDKLMVIDGDKNLELKYISEEDNPISSPYSLPFNYTINIPESNGPISLVKIYIVHLYPYLINPRTIELHILYTIAIEFQQEMQADLHQESLMEELEVPKGEEAILHEDLLMENVMHDKRSQEDEIKEMELDPSPQTPPFSSLKYIDFESETL